MSGRLIYPVLFFLLFSCTNKKRSIVGTWHLKVRKSVCTNESLQSVFGINETESEMPKVTYEFLQDSTFKKSTEKQEHYSSIDDNIKGVYSLHGDSLQLSYMGDRKETLIISELSQNKLAFIFKNSVTSGINPADKCDLYHYYEK
jgi:Lipocalin-like domain